MHTAGRLLYRFNADEAPSTYITNYAIAAVCLLGVALHLLLPPTPQPTPVKSASAFKDRRTTPAVLMLVHLTLYGVVMIVGGLGHHVWYHDECPGREMPANVTVPCPDGSDNVREIGGRLERIGPSARTPHTEGPRAFFGPPSLASKF